MGLLHTLGRAFGYGDEKRKPVEVEEDGTVLYREDIIAKIHSELERRRTERNPLEQQWRLNANFFI